MQGPHARAVSCPLCNEKFFPASLPFHQKQCEKRRAKRRVNCPYCKIEVSQKDLPDHIKVCPKGAAAAASSGRDRSRGPSGGGDGGGGGGGAAHSSCQGPAGQANFDAEVLEDGRMRCIYCGRYFGPDRIDKHQEICGKLKNARPAGVDGQPTQNGRRVFNSQAQRVEGGVGRVFVTPEQYKAQQEKKSKFLADQRARKSKSTWRHQHAQFQEVCRAGRDDDEDPRPSTGYSQPPRAASGGPGRPRTGTAASTPRRQASSPSSSRGGDGKVPCPYCQRRFEPSVADRHIPICANVQNRPKPPPSPGGSYRYGEDSADEAGEPSSPSSVPGSAKSVGGGNASRRTAGGSDARRLPPRGGQPRKKSTPRGGVAGSSSGAGASGTSMSGDGANSPCRLPSLPGTPTRERPGTSAAGPGAQAARSLRKDVTQRLPGGGGRRLASSHSEGSLQGTARAGQQQSRAYQPEQTQLPYETEEVEVASAAQPPQQRLQPASAAGRLGLRRSAMLFRLLSHVPREALERELTDSGVEASHLDEDGLIEAIFEKLA
eukprot:TRINITY_DN10410_c0_g2_i2.p1 TRINITY_DN10410_c0_g2~~TRINITY_DN10410_c0_g2_i2.p1  ORF type:complete len:545 (-),score=114.06 TRINITY_DN10410_c0_g2_i2:109-1743(-)